MHSLNKITTPFQSCAKRRIQIRALIEALCAGDNLWLCAIRRFAASQLLSVKENYKQLAFAFQTLLCLRARALATLPDCRFGSLTHARFQKLHPAIKSTVAAAPLPNDAPKHFASSWPRRCPKKSAVIAMSEHRVLQSHRTQDRGQCQGWTNKARVRARVCLSCMQPPRVTAGMFMHRDSLRGGTASDVPGQESF